MKTTLRKLTGAWPLAICLLLPTLTRAETPVQAWVQRHNGSSGGDDVPTAMAVDGSNNVIVTGYSPFSGSSRDYATIKYSSAGVPLWTNRYDGRVGPGSYNDEPLAIAVDSSNNVIVTGSSTLIGGVNSDYATIKYSSDGAPLWTNRYDGYSGPGYSYDEPAAVAVDGSNNVIVTGTAANSEGSYDYATIKYSSAGVPLWTNRYNGPANSSDVAAAMAVDGSNNVIVTGTSAGSGSLSDYATIKYSSEGMPLWTNRLNGPGNALDHGSAVAVDSSNQVVVTGYSQGSAASYDYATVGYSSDGVPLWTNRYGVGMVQFMFIDVVVDSSNNLIVTGNSSVGGGGPCDYATIKYSSAGVPLWTNRYNGPGNGADTALDAAVDGSNNVIVAGWSAGSASGYDYATIKYSSAGVPLWTNRYGVLGSAPDYAQAVVMDHSGNVIVTGYSPGNGSGYDFATVKYVCVPEPVLTGLQLTNGTLQMRVDDVLQPGTLVIEASTNLAEWAPVFTNTTPTNVLFYTDPDAGSLTTRYYRAFQFP